MGWGDNIPVLLHKVSVGPVCAHPALLQHTGGSAGSTGVSVYLPGLRASTLSWEQATCCPQSGHLSAP